MDNCFARMLLMPIQQWSMHSLKCKCFKMCLMYMDHNYIIYILFFLQETKQASQCANSLLDSLKREMSDLLCVNKPFLIFREE